MLFPRELDCVPLLQKKSHEQQSLGLPTKDIEEHDFPVPLTKQAIVGRWSLIGLYSVTPV